MLLNIDTQSRRKNMISLTPLIDVVFILLLFFMLSSTFSKWHRIELQTPVSSESQTPELVLLTIRSQQGEIQFGDELVSITNNVKLQQKISQYSKSSLVLSASKGITIQAVVHVMDALKKAGANKISYAGVAQ